MADTTTFFAKISSFFSAFFAYVLRALSSKHRSTTLCDDLEVGIIPSIERRVSGHFNTTFPVVSGSRSIDGFVDLGLDNKIKKTKTISIATHNVPAKTSVVDTVQSRHFQPTVKIDRPVPVLFPAIPMIHQVNVVDNRNKHRAFQFGPYSLYEDHRKLWSRRRQDSFSDLLDLFPSPPTYIPPLPPLINEDAVPQCVEKTPLAPAENCPSPTISEESTASSRSESNSILSTDPSISVSISISISDETANTSVHEILELPCTSAIFKVLSSGIDVKDKNISRLTLIHNPEILVSPTVPVVPTAPTKWVRPYVAPLRIVKKNKVQLPVVPLEPTVARRPLSGNWEQAMDDVLQAFRDAESEDGDFRDLFSGNDSFVSSRSPYHESHSNQ